MKGRIAPQEKGQTLIMVALAMMALLAFLALAIDVGQVYAERRRMQNAADAGALAGAWEKCFGEPTQAWDRAWEYAVTRNGAQDETEVFVYDTSVEVVARTQADMFFAGVIGVPTMDVVAEAEAACGGADSACGVWPIAYPQDDFNDYVAACPKDMYVWAGGQEGQSPNCWDDACYDCCDDDGCDNCDPEYQCSPDPCDCDLDDDGMDDVVDFYGRAWLSFTQLQDPEYGDNCDTPSYCSEQELVCWTKGDGGRVTIPEDGLCVPGKRGTTWGTKAAVEEVVGNTVGIPLYDSMECTRDPGVDLCGQGPVYNVIGLGCVAVVGTNERDDLILYYQIDDPDRTGNDI